MGEVAVTAAGDAAPAERRRRKPHVWFSAKVARAICRRVEAGEAVQVICRDAGMPTNGTVSNWARTLPGFRQSLDRAKARGGWPEGGRHAPATRGYCETVAREVFARLCEGETLGSICADPEMPSRSTVHRWRADVSEFAEAMALARQVQAEQFCELGWEIASAVTPVDAYATHVKLTQLRWTAGAMAPERFGRHKPVEAADRVERAPDEVVFRVRHFEKVTGPDGQQYVQEVPRLDGVRD